jgi:hypothetical protein
MAARQPEMKNLSVLQPGMPRSRVIAELGPPLDTRPTDRGGVDVFAFKQGYSRANRTARALGHAAGTIATAGFWEIAGIPLESWFDGTDVKLEVNYGPNGEVEGITVFEGTQAFRGKILSPHVQLASTPPPVGPHVPIASTPPPAEDAPATNQLRVAQNGIAPSEP